jgi:sugar phosphate permease
MQSAGRIVRGDLSPRKGGGYITRDRPATLSPPRMTPTDRPTRVRYTILGMLCLLAMITYLDRATMGIAKNDIMAAIGQDPVNFFWVLTAFQLAYALFEIPTG